MMDFDGKAVREGYELAFGHPIEDITIPQLEWLMKVVKHCRGRCRSNKALANYLNRNFSGHEFWEVLVAGAEGQEWKQIRIVKKGEKG